MTVSYRNRKGEVYFLSRIPTKRGRFRYHFAKQEKPNPVLKIPAGYEIYEHPNGQVFLRKKEAESFTREQIIKIRGICDRFLDPSNYILNIQNQKLEIYIAQLATQQQEGTLTIEIQPDQAEIDSFVSKDVFDPVFRLSQTRSKNRTHYTIEKYYEDELPKHWLVVDNSANLASLLRKQLQKYRRYMQSYSKFQMDPDKREN